MCSQFQKKEQGSSESSSEEGKNLYLSIVPVIVHHLISYPIDHHNFLKFKQKKRIRIHHLDLLRSRKMPY